jgi:hypothetical protein
MPAVAETIGTGSGFWLGFAERRRQGWGRLALSDIKKSRRSARQPSGAGDGEATDRDVGHALRSVYAKTVSEDIPDELLDLLGKLN